MKVQVRALTSRTLYQHLAASQKVWFDYEVNVTHAVGEAVLSFNQQADREQGRDTSTEWRLTEDAEPGTPWPEQEEVGI